MALDSTQAAIDWAAGMQAAGPKIERKVRALTVNPAAQAVAAAGVWQQAVSSSAALAKYKGSLSKVSLADYQTAMIEKGIPNMQNGARQSQDKVARALAPVFTFLQGVQARVRGMPRGPRGSEANYARMNAQARGMAMYRKGG